MTVIAGYTDGNTWAIAADSGLFESNSDGTSYTDLWWPTSTPKVWRVGDSLLGFSGVGAADDIAIASKLGDPYKLADYLREFKEKGADPEKDWDIMVVTQRTVFMVWQDFSVSKMKRHYHSSGGAAAPALGALASGKAFKAPPLQVVRVAAQAAIDHHTGARAPVVSIGLPKKTEDLTAPSKSDKVV